MPGTDYQLMSSWQEVDAAAQAVKNQLFLLTANLTRILAAEGLGEVKFDPTTGKLYIELPEIPEGYSVPDGGIPLEDLSESVMNLLARAGGFAVNSQGASVTARTASINGYRLVAGALVTVRFASDVPAGATLNISANNGSTYTGAKSIYYGSAALGAGIVKAGTTATMIYDGSYYRIIAMTPGYIAPRSITAEMLADSIGNVENVVYISAEVTGATNLLSETTAADIAYQIAGLGKNILYCLVDPADNGLAYMDARPAPPAANVETVSFSRLDLANSRIIWYTLYTDGTIAKGTTPIGGSSSSGGATTLPELGGGYAESGGTGNSASTVARKATISGYVLTVGNGPTIKFTNGITATNPTFNVNNGTSNTGAMPIWYRGAALPPGVVENGALVKLVYDGAHYCIESIDNAPTIWGFDSASQYGSYGSTVAVGDYVMYPVSGRLHLFRKASGGLTDLWTFPAFYIKDAAGIPQSDLAKLVVTVTDAAGGAGYACDTTLADILAANTAGKQIEIYYGTKKGHVLEIGATYVLFDVVVENNNSAKLLRFTISGTGAAAAEYPLGYTGPTITTPTQAQNGYVLKANADGSTSWVSISSLLTAWTPNNPYGGGT